MTRAPLRVAIIGAGLMGRVHTEAARNSGGRLTAVVDPAGEAAGRLASEFGVRSITRDELLAGGVADVVHVCSPPDSHANECESALRAGMHVLCEKPVTQTAAELESLFELAQSSDLLLCPVHQFPMQDGIRQIRSAHASLGKIRHIAAEICTAGADGLSDEARHQIALDILSHPLSLCAALDAAPLSRAKWSVAVSAPGEMIVTGVSGEILISYLISTRGRPTSNLLRVIGESGTATADLYHGYSYIEGGAVSRARKATRPFAASGLAFSSAAINGIKRALEGETAFPGLRTLVKGFYDAIGNRGLPPITPSECLDIARARDTIVALSSSGLSQAQSKSGAVSSP
jgi:predicted dehydrogenase